MTDGEEEERLQDEEEEAEGERRDSQMLPAPLHPSEGHTLNVTLNTLNDAWRRPRFAIRSNLFL
jgi:hypothetical protein